MPRYSDLPTAPELAKLCGVTERQARRWRRQGLPEYARKLVAIFIDGNLSEIDPTWHGWRLLRGRLTYGADCIPSMLPNELTYFDWFQMLQRHYQREIKQLRVNGLNTSQCEALRDTLSAVEACQSAMIRAQRLLTQCVIQSPNEDERKAPCIQIANKD